MSAGRFRTSFTHANGVGRLGSLSVTLGAGSVIQLFGALAGFVTVPLLVNALGPSAFGVLVVVVSLAPWLTLVDGALYPATRLLVGESRTSGRVTAPSTLLRSALRVALKIAGMNLATLLVGVAVVPLVALFGSQGIASRSELVLAILAFSMPIIASGPGGVYLGALEGVGRTVVAALFTGIGPLVALPATVVVSYLGGGLSTLCFVQGIAVALPRFSAWVYWSLRPSVDTDPGKASRGGLRLALLFQMVLLTAAALVQSGLDPVIVSSQLGADAAATFGVAQRIVNGAMIPIVVISPLFAANLAAARGTGWSTTQNRELRHLVVQAGVIGLAVGVCVAVLGPVAARLLGAGQVSVQVSLYAAGGVFAFASFLSTPLYLAFSGPRGLRRSLRLNVVLVVGNVSASLVLVRVIGASGPLWASAVAGLVAASHWLVVWRRHPDWLGETHSRGELQPAATEVDPEEGP